MKKIFRNCSRVKVESCCSCERYLECKQKSRKMVATKSKKQNWLFDEDDSIKTIICKVITFIIFGLSVILLFISTIGALVYKTSAQSLKTDEVIKEISVFTEESKTTEKYEITEKSDVANESIEKIEKSEETTETDTIEESKVTEEVVISEKSETEEIIAIETFNNVKSDPILSAEGPSEKYYHHISYDDKVIIAKVVYAEARGESFEGKVAVAAVILNRYFYGEGMGFTRKSIYSVVTQKNQFASISNVTQAKLNQIPSCMEAVEAACKGWDPTRNIFEKGAMFFFNPKGLSKGAANDREGIKTMKIGNHLFHYDFSKN